MKPYGWRLPNKHQYLCRCAMCRDELSSPRAREAVWTAKLIAEQLEAEALRAPCEDKYGFCPDCYVAVPRVD